MLLPQADAELQVAEAHLHKLEEEMRLAHEAVAKARHSTSQSKRKLDQVS
jgi:hypothetical protein